MTQVCEELCTGVGTNVRESEKLRYLCLSFLTLSNESIEKTWQHDKDIVVDIRVAQVLRKWQTWKNLIQSNLIKQLRHQTIQTNQTIQRNQTNQKY